MDQNRKKKGEGESTVKRNDPDLDELLVRSHVLIDEWNEALPRAVHDGQNAPNLNVAMLKDR